MNKILGQKWLIVAVGLVGLLSLGLSAAALRNLRFEPTLPLAVKWEQAGALPVSSGPSDITFLELLMVVGLIALVFSLIFMLIDPKLRRKLLISLVRLALFFALAAILVQQNNFQPAVPVTPTPAIVAAGQSATGLDVPSQTFEPPQVTPWAQYLISLGLTLAMLFFFGWLYLRSKRRTNPGAVSLDQIANIARQTLKGLEEGQPWDDIIVDCYVKMTRVVEQERGLLRQVAMTPAEFALKLERAGLPGEAVRTLTHLFEEVRYGARQQASREQRDLAVASLHAILRACGVNP